MKKNVLFIVILFVMTYAASAQTEKPEIVTDRPDQTEAPSLVPAGGLQVETGVILEKDHDGDVTATNTTYNTTLIKYGINEHIELRFISEFLGESVKQSENELAKATGFSPLALGVKIKIAEEKGFWPQAAFIGHINLKTGAEAFAPSYTAADFRFTFAHTLSDRFSLSYNLGAEWDGETPDATFLYTLSLGYVISDRAGFFIEGYSFFPENAKADNRIDAGLTYKFTPVVQWDISAGLGLSDNAPDYFLSTGISFRAFK
jgi:hypothetical protein